MGRNKGGRDEGVEAVGEAEAVGEVGEGKSQHRSE